jgi:endonuclease/exonuclease/phosphatase family metal-dependent hydrolase
MRSVLIIFLTFLSLNLSAQTDIKVMFYNLLHFPSTLPANRDVILKNILNRYEPDLFLVCELETEASANIISNVSLSEINKNYARAQYVNIQSAGNSLLEQLVFYNTDFFILESQEVIITNYRDLNHYTFILNTTDHVTNPKRLEVFVTHLKANQGSTNEQSRLLSINEFATALDDLNPDSFVLFAGDFNVYSSNEPAYQKILDAGNNIVIKDLQNLTNSVQNWHNNATYQTIHTQSTRTSSAEFGDGAGGGMDDQFDFIFLSENLLNNSETVHYKANTYDSYGNNENCFNNRIDAAACNGAFSQNLRNDLYNMSDHLPVILELQSNQTLSITENNYQTSLIKLPQGNLIKNTLSLQLDQTLLHKKIKIVNTLGQTIYNTKITSTNLTIDTSNFSNTVYYIKIDTYYDVVKFVKL